MELNNLILEKKDHIAIITINHPPANAWNLATIQEFIKVIDDVEADKNVRVVVITGAGEKCFSAGMDVADAGNAPTSVPMGRELWRRIDRMTKPTIAAINGFCLGGGLELALCCHFRLMVDHPKATAGLVELNLGIIPGWGGTQRLCAIVGKAKALDLILFSKKIGAKEALEIGLINKISEPGKVLEDALGLAAILAKRPPLAVMSVLKAISAGEYEGRDAGLKIEADGGNLVATSQDAIEGFVAFMQKREPNFKGE